MTALSLIGYASGIAANDKGCGEGPLLLQRDGLEKQLSIQHLAAGWHAMLVPSQGSEDDRLQRVVELNTQLAAITFDLTQQKKHFALLGGDHSCAIGTWSGVASALAQQNGELGLIWIDAHMDSHTFETTLTGNIHGMPLAALLGYGDTPLTHIAMSQPKINPKRLVLIGIRSFEAEEEKLLQRLGIRIYNMEAIAKQGLESVLSDAIAYVKETSVGFGVSLDLDGIDPFDAPGVGVPEANGISGKELCQGLKQLRQESQLIGVEVVEYNPYHDKGCKTKRLIQEILLSIFGV
ncbi:MAG: arginase [Pseudomonadota bacterium]|jgi:arginase